MKAIAACLLTIFCSQSHAAVNEIVDRFTGKTTLAMPFPAMTTMDWKLQKLRPMGVVIVKDGKITENTLALTAIFESWKYMQCHESHWLLDGSPFQLPQGKYVGNVEKIGVSEIIAIPLTMESMKQIAAAKVVEFEVCNDEFKFSDEELADFRELTAKAASLAK